MSLLGRTIWLLPFALHAGYAAAVHPHFPGMVGRTAESAGTPLFRFYLLWSLVVSGANVLLLDEPTNNLDPASRKEVLAALSTYRGAVVLVTHDEGAVQSLAPEKVLLLPDAVEDLWRDDYLDLVALA